MMDEIAFIACPARDMHRAVDFYRRVLGLTLLFQREDWSEFKAGGVRLALYVDDNPGPPPARPALSFLARPIAETVARLQAQGVRMDGGIECHDYGKLAVFFDSEGNRLGLYEPPTA